MRNYFVVAFLRCRQLLSMMLNIPPIFRAEKRNETASLGLEKASHIVAWLRSTLDVWACLLYRTMKSEMLATFQLQNESGSYLTVSNMKLPACYFSASK